MDDDLDVDIAECEHHAEACDICLGLDERGNVEHPEAWLQANPRAPVWLRDMVHSLLPSMPLRPPSPAVGRNGRWERIGEVGVDSASIGITDLVQNGRIDGCSFKTNDPNAHYAARNSDWAGDWGTGIRFWAGFGDGSYDIWGWIADYGEDGEVDERVAQVVITMIDEDELTDWRSLP